MFVMLSRLSIKIITSIVKVRNVYYQCCGNMVEYLVRKITLQKAE